MDSVPHPPKQNNLQYDVIKRNHLRCDVCSVMATDVGRKTLENEKLHSILQVLQEKDSLQRKEIEELQEKLNRAEKERDELERLP